MTKICVWVWVVGLISGINMGVPEALELLVLSPLRPLLPPP